MSYYLVTFTNKQGFSQEKIHQVITTIPTVTDWWHYLPEVYIVSTTNAAKYISDQIISKLKGLSFLTVKVDIKDYNGVLNKDAWEWFRKKNNQLIRIRPISQPKPTISDVSIVDALKSLSKTNPSPNSMSTQDLMDYLLGKKK